MNRGRTSGLPPWLCGDAALAVLGALAAVEVLMAHVPELRRAMIHSDAEIKGIGAFLLCFVLVEGDPRDLLAHLIEEGLSTDYVWGRSTAYSWSFAIGWTVWLGARLRSGVYEVLLEADEDDSVGLQKLLAWAEDGIGFFGVLTWRRFAIRCSASWRTSARGSPGSARTCWPTRAPWAARSSDALSPPAPVTPSRRPSSTRAARRRGSGTAPRP